MNSENTNDTIALLISTSGINHHSCYLHVQRPLFVSLSSFLFCSLALSFFLSLSLILSLPLFDFLSLFLSRFKPLTSDPFTDAADAPVT